MQSSPWPCMLDTARGRSVSHRLTLRSVQSRLASWALPNSSMLGSDCSTCGSRQASAQQHPASLVRRAAA